MPDDPDIIAVLMARRTPARYTYRQASIRLNCTESDIALGVRLHFFEPLGKPPQNGHKYLAAEDVEKVASDRRLLEKFSRQIYQFHTARNRRYAERNGRNRAKDARLFSGSCS